MIFDPKHTEEEILASPNNFTSLSILDQRGKAPAERASQRTTAKGIKGKMEESKINQQTFTSEDVVVQHSDEQVCTDMDDINNVITMASEKALMALSGGNLIDKPSFGDDDTVCTYGFKELLLRQNCGNQVLQAL